MTRYQAVRLRGYRANSNSRRSRHSPGTETGAADPVYSVLGTLRARVTSIALLRSILVWGYRGVLVFAGYDGCCIVRTRDKTAGPHRCQDGRLDHHHHTPLYTHTLAREKTTTGPRTNNYDFPGNHHCLYVYN